MFHYVFAYNINKGSDSILLSINSSGDVSSRSEIVVNYISMGISQLIRWTISPLE